MTSHIPRYMDTYLGASMAAFPAIMIDGAKGIGKTRTCKRFAKSIIRLSRKSERDLLEDNYDGLYDLVTPLLLDEWQRLPEVWDRVKDMVDEGLGAGSVLLTGSIQSSNPDIHSGAGRIIRFRMRPLSLAERFRLKDSITLSDCLQRSLPDHIEAWTQVTPEQYMEEITRSGFPMIYSAPEEFRPTMLDSYIDNITGREFASQGIRIRQPQVLRKWMAAYAAATGTETSYTKILDAATPGEDSKPAKVTTAAYREALTSLWLLDELPAWGSGEDFLGRLKQTPKHYLGDPALEARLLNLSTGDLIMDTTTSPFDDKYDSIAGRLFESLCAMSIRTYAAVLGAQVSYLRDLNGTHEIDFIIQKDQSLVAIEVKKGVTIDDNDVKHLNWFEGKVGSRLKEKIVLYTGEQAYRRQQDGVLVVPAALLG